jgi:putative ABC transport system permease protein
MRFEHWRYIVPLRWRSIVRRREVDRDLDDELAYHLEEEIDTLAERGVDAPEARRIALGRPGDLERVKERCRDARGTAFVEDTLNDLRYGARMLRRTPTFTAVAVLTLALGIGANTAVFSLVDGILLTPLPYPAPERLVSVTGTYPNGAFDELRDTTTTMDVATYAEGHFLLLSGNGEPRRVSATLVSAEWLSVLGAAPAIGRSTRPGEDRAGHDRAVILRDALWRERFGADPHVVGRFVKLDGVAREVIGVMPPSFRFPSARTEIWLPLGLDARDTSHYWAGDFMPVIGRLRPGATIERARDEIRVFQSHITARFPWPMPASWNRDVTVMPLADWLVAGVRSRLLIFLAAVVLVLVIACANVANLSLSRGLSREREIAIRAAIGAGPRRIARQLLTESVLLAVIGGVAGLLVAIQGIALLRLVLPADTPRLLDVHVNWRVLAATAALAILSGCAFGLAPVVQAYRMRLRSAMDGGARDGRRAVSWPLRAALTIAQVACAVLLVIAAALLVRSFWSLTRVDPGFTPDDVVTAAVSPGASVCGTPERCFAFYRAFEEQVRAAPGIDGAAFVNTLPLTGAVAKRSLEVEGYTANEPLFWIHAITPEYFDVMHIRVESGRTFTPSDLAGGPAVAVVPASTARRFWPGTSPLGRQVRFVGEQRWHTIVGVVADVRGYDMTRSVPGWMAGAIYVPHGPYATMEDGKVPVNMSLAVRTPMESERVGQLLRGIAREQGVELAITDVRPMRAVIEKAVAAPAATTSLLVAVATLALVLGCVGVYGVLAFLVSRQTRELGVRLALGAQRRDVFWLVMREGAGLSLSGIVLGLAGALALARWMASELYGVSPTDPATYATVAIVVSLATLAACYVPTRRAMSVDPLIVLRDS